MNKPTLDERIEQWKEDLGDVASITAEESDALDIIDELQKKNAELENVLDSFSNREKGDF